MEFELRKIQLKDGRQCILRPAGEADARELVDYLKCTAAQTPFLLRNPDEVTFTEEGERAFLRQNLADSGCAMMNAVVDGVLAGNCSFSPVGSLRRLRHRCSMGIALKQEFWGLGLGAAMLEYLLELAHRAGFAQMELEVMEGNDTARRLYEKFGFLETGKIPNAIRYDDGSLRDVILMYSCLEEGENNDS